MEETIALGVSLLTTGIGAFLVAYLRRSRKNARKYVLRNDVIKKIAD